MVDVTLLEINLEGAEFVANAPFSGEKSKKSGKLSKMLGSSSSGSSSGEQSSGESSENESEGGGAPIGAIVGVVALVGAVLLIRRLRGGDEEGQHDLDEYEVEADFEAEADD